MTSKANFAATIVEKDQASSVNVTIHHSARRCSGLTSGTGFLAIAAASLIAGLSPSPSVSRPQCGSKWADAAANSNSFGAPLCMRFCVENGPMSTHPLPLSFRAPRLRIPFGLLDLAAAIIKQEPQLAPIVKD